MPRRKSPLKQVSAASELDLRVNLILIFFCLLSALVTVRLFSIQVLSHKKYKALAQDQYWNSQYIQPRRGNILSSEGFVLAGTQLRYLLFAEPQKIENKYAFAHNMGEVLGALEVAEEVEDLERELLKTPPLPESTESIESRQPVTKISEEELQRRKEALELALKDGVFAEYYQDLTEKLDTELFWIALKKDLTLSEKERIEGYEFKWIGFDETPSRFYPEGSLAAHVLGFVAGNEQGEEQGYWGIEGSFDKDLRGKMGRVVQQLDALGNPILVEGYKEIDSIDGRDLVLTLNRSVQYIVESSLKEGVGKYGAISGSVVVMDPMTGNVLALANYPTYDPQRFWVESAPSEQNPERKTAEVKNLAISATYEPGSVMKPFTVGTAIELGLVTPKTTFVDGGSVVYSDYTIDNWDGRHYGEQTIVQLLQKSNNVGAAWVGQLVGADNLSTSLGTFGFGELSGVDLAGEDTGTINADRFWTDIDVATAAFGQGISATPLQVLNAFNVYANGGDLLRPRIVSKIVDEDGVEIEMPVQVVRRVVSKETAATMNEMLVSAVSGGESSYFNLKNYKIAGKTGTAQIPVGGEYDPKKTNCTFAGYMDTTRKFSMIVRLEQPTSSVYAAETAVPLWMKIAGDLAQYYGLTPDVVN